MTQASPSPVALSIVLPVRDERENLPWIVETIQQTLNEIAYELIVVDGNSKDGSWQWALEQSAQNANFRLIRKVRQTAHYEAILTGLLSARGEALVVLEADQQQDPRLIPQMLEVLPECDVVSGSRYLQADAHQQWPANRKRGAQWLNRFGRLLLPQKLTDPLSSFFMISRSTLHELAPTLPQTGSDVLFEMLRHRPKLRVTELPYSQKNRVYGQSKRQGWLFFGMLELLLSCCVAPAIAWNMARFASITALGLVFHVLLLWLVHAQLGMPAVTALLLVLEGGFLLRLGINNQWLGSLELNPRQVLRRHLLHLPAFLIHFGIFWHLVAHDFHWLIATFFGGLFSIGWTYCSESIQ